jgi:hypothetical protein
VQHVLRVRSSYDPAHLPLKDVIAACVSGDLLKDAPATALADAVRRPQLLIGSHHQARRLEALALAPRLQNQAQSPNAKRGRENCKENKPGFRCQTRPFLNGPPDVRQSDQPEDNAGRHDVCPHGSLHDTLLLNRDHLPRGSRDATVAALDWIIAVRRRGRRQNVDLVKTGADQTGKGHGRGGSANLAHRQ